MIADSGRQVDRDLYQIARDEVKMKLTVPTYFINHIDHTIDLNINRYCLCPFHIEDTPSFVYKAEEDYWRCFGACRTGGTAIDLHKHKFGFESHFDALLDLRERFGDMYNLQFKNFFLDELNGELSIDDIIKKSSSGLSREDFLNSNEKSITTILSSIENELARIKILSLETYIKCVIYVDNHHVYGKTEISDYEKVLQKLKTIKWGGTNGSSIKLFNRARMVRPK